MTRGRQQPTQMALLDVFMLLVAVLVMQPVGDPTGAAIEKRMNTPEPGHSSSAGVRLRALEVRVRGDGYWVENEAVSLARLARMIRSGKYAALSVTADPGALHATVSRIESLAGESGLRIYETEGDQ